MKLAILTLLAGYASAFAPQQNGANTLSLSASFENEVGAQRPLGFWDPLNLLLDQDQERFDRLRYVETKHGRVAMLAVAGHIATTLGLRLDGNIATGVTFASIPTGVKGLSAIPTGGLVQIVLFIGFLELFVMKDVSGDSSEFPGDFRNNSFDFGWDTFSDEEKLQKRGIELNNGRAAQMGILGLMVHEMLGQDPYVINGLMGYSTL